MPASSLRRASLVFSILCLTACDGGATPTLAPIDPASARVDGELRIELTVDNPSGAIIDLEVMGPDLPSFDRVTNLSVHPGGGTFTWVPLSSHVGMHELTFVLTAGEGGGAYDEQTVLVEILPSDDAAPVFVRPGAGGTFDLTASPCVSFDVEVRDDDSETVQIRTRAPLPERATLANAGPKRAMFDWCPTPDQVAASERWTIQLAADDGGHPAVEHDYVIVLRSGPPREGCPGSAPVITLESPLASERVTSGTSFPVAIRVTDDMGLRDAPLLYYTTTEPDDPTRPDVTQFEQLTFADDGDGAFIARIPSPGLAQGEEAEIFYLVSATDNDDPAGSLCDHRTDSPLVAFIAVGGEPADGTLAECALCAASSECASGICAATAAGGRCVDACSGDGACDAGTCGATVTVEGGTRAGCGPTSEVCGGGGGSCTDDSREEDDTPATATPYTSPITDGQLCASDDDYFAISVPGGNRVTVTLDGFMHTTADLDLSLASASGTILASSASVRATESVSYCNPDGAVTLHARVYGYGGSQSPYSLRADVAPDAGGCCTDDAGENDDTRNTARAVTFTSDVASFDGTVCPADDDWVAIPMSGPGRIEVLVAFSHAAGDIDLQLYDPAGTRVGSSLGTTDEETIDVMVSGGGTYALRIFAYGEGNPDGYLGEITRTLGTGCTDTGECPLGTVCEGGSCASDACTSASECPAAHSCPTAGPSGAARHCAASCTVNSDCRDREACKRFVDGLGCGRTGGGANGASCASFADCGGQRTCVGWPGGYCARAACTSNADCETGTWCVTEGGLNVCALSCVSASCREAEGYACEFLPTLGGTERFVCVPG